MSAELMKSKFVRRPSVRLWHRSSLKSLHGFLSNFSCGFPWAICLDVFFFFIFEHFYFDFLRIFFVFVNMGPYWSQNFKNATPPSNHFWILSNFFWNLFSVVLTKVLFSIFEILRLWFFTIFSFSLTWDPVWKPKLHNATPPWNHVWTLSNVFWFFFSVVLCGVSGVWWFTCRVLSRVFLVGWLSRACASAFFYSDTLSARDVGFVRSEFQPEFIGKYRSHCQTKEMVTVNRNNIENNGK